jgi:eukaryotic-like serine/threonine-protein kinase
MNEGGTGSPPRVIGERYTLLDLLGSGLMGQVYRAHDAERGSDVALKILRDAEDLLGLKHEFRSLADLRHPNLAALHELVVAPDLSFLTMELVSGVDFVSWVRAREEGRVERLREALPQLLDGLEALHAAGRIHRDIKPSNVLVTAEGRVVLVDFGLAFTRPLLVSSRGGEAGFAGTPDYMAPEQLWGAPPSPASDAYALGATLFEALTGELPFRGDVQASLTNRASGAGPSPRERDPSVAADLDELVRGLLDSDPARRPDIDAMRRSIGAPGSRAELLPSSASVWEAPFVDREESVAALAAALEEVRAGSAVAIRIEGPSGIGKSALVRHFVASIPEAERIVVLAGRCYPQESVPFKALDPLVDALSGFLERLDGADLALVVPDHAAALLRLFPVLGRCSRLREIADRSVLPPEPDEIRRAGFAELLELLRRVSARFTLVLWIDDLQWGDSDSAIFLRGLASSREAPPLLLLLTHRGAEWEMSAMRAALAESGGPVFARAIELAPLPPTYARALARDLVSRVDVSPSPTLDEIVRESGGNPFLVCELARHCAARVGGAAEPLPVGVTEIVAERVRRIDEGARRLLSVVAVAGGPCSRSAAAHAAGLELGVDAAIGLLRNQCLVRDSAGGRAQLETYHDRIREGVLDGIATDERRSIHLSLAGALELEPDVDPFLLVEHYRGGGDDVRAARAAVEAARRAYAALAFEQAARLYELALRIGRDETERWRWHRGRADALAQAGRGGDAGAAYHEAAAALAGQGGGADEVNELVRLEAEQYLRSGYLEEGRAALRRVLGAVGERYPRTTVAALASLVRQRASLAMRGLRHARRAESEISKPELRRIDTCWAAAEGLIWADGIRSADFQARHTRLALAAGEPTRVVRALCTEGAFQALFGTAWGSRRARLALDAARELAAELDSPLAEGLTAVCEAAATYLSGNFPEGHRHSVRAEEILRTRCTGVAWELTNVHIFGSWSLAHMGEIDALHQTMPDLLQRARERGDLLAYCTLLGGMPNVIRLLAEDSVDAARAAVEEAGRRWPTVDFQLPNYFALVSAALIDLYEGHPAAARERLEQRWPTIRAVGLLAFRLVRTEARQLRARCALAALAENSSAQQIPRVARNAVRQIDREAMPWAEPLAAAVAASIHAREGNDGAMSETLARAAAGFDDAAMRVWAAVARHQAGDTGGTGALTAAGIRNPARFAEALIPIQALRGARATARRP